MSQSNNILCMLQQQFTHLRKQESNINITSDLINVVNIIANRSNNPVSLLRTIGIIFLGKRTAAFNFFALQSQIICTRSLAMTSLVKEGWSEVENEKMNLETIIGKNKVKNWTIMNIPDVSAVAKLLDANPRFIASENNFLLDLQPEMVLIGPGMPQPNVVVEPYYPLVSLQYERTIDKYSFNVEPLDKLVSNQNHKHFSIFKAEVIDIPYNDKKE